MEKMNDLKDLLRHEIQDLYSAEEQIIAALPMMIEKAKNTDLKKSLQDHLSLTHQHRSRLEQVQNILNDNQENQNEKKGLLSRLFRSRQVCRGMQGLIEEGNKLMREDMHPDVLDAVIIASAQKIEHYEICGYGTVRTFSRELNLPQVTQLLEQTLNEEYKADDLLTQLAVTRVNREAENKAGKKAGLKNRNHAAAPQRIKNGEPEMQLASAKRASATTKRNTNRGGAAPRGSEASRNNVSPGRNRTATKPNVADNTRAETRSARGSGRSSGSGRRSA
ncbi:MAG: YciE/YciF ferroxidase family protein [Flavisolibacter sp.]